MIQPLIDAVREAGITPLSLMKQPEERPVGLQWESRHRHGLVLNFRSSPMAITEGRFNRLEERVNDLGGRLSNIEGAIGVRDRKQTNWTAWLPVGAPVVALIAITVTLGLHLDNKIGAAQKDIQASNTRVGKVEDAVKALANQQTDQTQKLIHDLLAIAKGAAKADVAARATQTAAALTAALREEKRPAPPEFFQAATLATDALGKQGGQGLKDVAFQTQRQLAEYRSTLQPPLTIGATMFCTSDFNGESWTRGPKTVSSLTVMNCPQILDGIGWRNVAFVNSRIIYRGGPLILDHVIFVNCTFEVQKSDNGRDLLQYATLDKKELRIRPEAIPTSAGSSGI